MGTSRFSPTLVPVDGSPLAEKAIPVAAALARRAGAALQLAFVQPVAPRYPHVPAEIAKSIEREAEQRVRAYLAITAEAVATCHGLEATGVVLDGPPAEALADYARTKQIGLIVMTTHGRSGLGRFWLGSVADRLLRRTTTPVLLLRSKEQPQRTDFRHILVALDGSSADQKVLEVAAALASLYHEAHCSLVQVVEPPVPIVDDLTVYPNPIGAELIEQQQSEATASLERLAGGLRTLGVGVTTHVVAARGIGAQILALAHKLGSGAIAVGTPGRHGAERLLLGSVVDKVVRGATDPVLVVPVQAGRD
jgi:nucleotide-binding universal stress UspA family protein